MNISSEISNHFQQIYFGGNWTWSNLKDTLSDLSWAQANKKMEGYHSIAELTYHIHYFVRAQMNFLKTDRLEANDKFSFDLPQIDSENEWNEFLKTIWAEAEENIELIANIPNEKWSQNFVEEKYGSFYRNFHGMIEHCHYHLGQIVLLKKLTTIL